MSMRMTGFWSLGVVQAVACWGAIPEGFGQLKKEPEIIQGGVDERGREFVYLGQEAGKGKLILTASNGFFSKETAVARGESTLPKVGDEHLIVPNFEHLEWKKAEGSLRWHVHFRKPGTVRFLVHLKVDQAGSDIEVRFGDETRKVRTSTSDSKTPQPWELLFEVKKAGAYLFSLQSNKMADPAGVGRLHRVDAYGPAVEGAHLLRVRWRPPAAHGSYEASRLDEVRTIVFTTRSMEDVSSYSPITTPFGYYGTTFGNDRRSGGSFNFSMWGKKGAVDDLRLMPHLLGVGSPQGEFSGFGHEGSGVKPRGWIPMPDRPERVVQALRVVPGEEYDSYFGYYFDHPLKSWKFFGAGNKWHGGKPRLHLKLGSFCEVPGPPQVERTGDVYREVRRRLWAFREGNWISMDTYLPGGKGGKGEVAVNKSWYTTNEGEYAMGCGGIRLYRHQKEWVKVGTAEDQLPDFLKSPSLKNVFLLPIEFGEIRAENISPTSATIAIDIRKSGKLEKGTVFFGPFDALTFAPRKLHGTERNSELSKTVNNRVWRKNSELVSPQRGVNRVELKNLKPGTTYFYRVLMQDSESRIWNEKTLKFTTPKKA